MKGYTCKKLTQLGYSVWELGKKSTLGKGGETVPLKDEKKLPAEEKDNLILVNVVTPNLIIIDKCVGKRKNERDFEHFKAGNININIIFI